MDDPLLFAVSAVFVILAGFMGAASTVIVYFLIVSESFRRAVVYLLDDSRELEEPNRRGAERAVAAPLPQLRRIPTPSPPR